jgi:N-acetylmuramoyl-L-alanine amidase
VEILNHRLPVPFKDSPNHGGFLTAPSLIVIHYTGGRSFQNAVSALCNPHPPEGQGRRSAHLVIDVSGKLSQLVPFNREAWHAGESTWKGKEHCNKFSIGIELVNPGW